MNAAVQPLTESLHVSESRAIAELLLEKVGSVAEHALTRGDSLAREALVELIACGFSLGRTRGLQDAEDAR
jgi:hypothetical protein